MLRLVMGMRRGLRAAANLVLLCSAVVCLGPACAEPERGDQIFRVGLLTLGFIQEGGWSHSAYQGLERVGREAGTEIAHQVVLTDQDGEAAFRNFGARGFDLVFGHGSELEDAAKKVGMEYPETIFIITGGSAVRPNLAPMGFALEQATYVLGFVGGAISRRARIGAVGGEDLPSVAKTFFSFEEGARGARPRIKMSLSYTGSSTDTEAVREATLAQIEAGADVLIHNTGQAASGFFQAIGESQGVLAFGTSQNQNDLAPQAVLASAIIDLPLAISMVAREVRSGQFWARPIRFGLREGVIKIEWNQALSSRVPEKVKREADALLELIKTGAQEVPRPGF
jgi:basic membrane protein A